MAKLVSGALTEKYRIVKEGVEKIMRGRVIETEASRIYREGAKEADRKRDLPRTPRQCWMMGWSPRGLHVYFILL